MSNTDRTPDWVKSQQVILRTALQDRIAYLHGLGLTDASQQCQDTYALLRKLGENWHAGG
jgi:hypothetical protein